jgi:hypothetical protein
MMRTDPVHKILNHRDPPRAMLIAEAIEDDPYYESRVAGIPEPEVAMRRREFVAGVAATVLPLAARAQRVELTRRDHGGRAGL